MAVLQKKLVWKSIEALHEEALEVLPHASTNDDFVTLESSAVSHERVPANQTTQISNGDVVARIDRLLQKLDEDETIAAELLTPRHTNHLAAVKHDEDTDYETVSVKKEINETSEISSTISNNADQDDALADIATAIRDAQQNPSEITVSSKNRDPEPPFDMAFLSTTITNEVREAVSLILTSEMPNVIRKAVDESIKESQAALNIRQEPTPVKKTRTKSRAKQKADVKKTVKKKPGSNKSTTKKIS